MRENLSARQAVGRAAGLAGACAAARPSEAACRARLVCCPQDAQEALDMCLVGALLARDPRVGLPSEAVVEGHDVAEPVEVPSPEQVRGLLAKAPGGTGTSPREPLAHDLRGSRATAEGKPTGSVRLNGPGEDGQARSAEAFRAACETHKAMTRALNAIDEAEEALERAFGRGYPGTLEEHGCEDADYVVVALGGLAKSLKGQVDRLREQGMAVGLLRVRYLRPFDAKMLALSLAHARAVGVVETQVSPGAEGPLFSLMNSALYQHGVHVPTTDFICDPDEGVTPAQAQGLFKALAYTASFAADKVQFLGAGSLADALGATGGTEQG